MLNHYLSRYNSLMNAQYFAQTFDEIANKIAEHEFCVMDDFISKEIVTALAREVQNLHLETSLHQAGTGMGVATVNQALRGDYIGWLNDGKTNLQTNTEIKNSEAQAAYFEKMESLRLHLNTHLYLGLFGLESHLALYPAGACYKKHIDRFKNIRVNDGKPARQISCILYLNENWEDAFGGQLRVYKNIENEVFFNEKFFDILPISGRLVAFLSDTFYHEVLSATQPRMSVTGWFLTR